MQYQVKMLHLFQYPAIHLYLLASNCRCIGIDVLIGIKLFSLKLLPLTIFAIIFHLGYYIINLVRQIEVFASDVDITNSQFRCTRNINLLRCDRLLTKTQFNFINSVAFLPPSSLSK